jgi:outer membrane protein assembly factor BamB
MNLILMLATLVASAHASTASWPTFRNGPANSGVTKLSLSSDATDLVSLDLGGLIWATPVLDADGNVYVGSSNKRFTSYAPDGSVRWSASLLDRPDSLIDSAAALTPSGAVVVPGGDGYLHAFDARTGSPLWSFRSYAASASSAQSGTQVNSFEGNVQVGADGTVYAGSDNGTLYAVGGDGKEKWHFATGMMIWSSPVLSSAGDWLAFGSLDGHVYLLSQADGTLLAKLDIGSDVKATLASDGGDRLFFGASDGKFRAARVERDARGGYRLRVEWSFATKGEIYSSAAWSGDHLYFGGMDGHVYSLDANGKLAWSYATYSPVASSPLLTADGSIIAGAGNGTLYVLDARTGERRWSLATRTSTRKVNLDSSPVLDARGRIWVGSYSGEIYRVGAGYCSANPSACASGGMADTPLFGLASVPREGATLRYSDTDGLFRDQPVAPLGKASPIHLRLAVYKDGAFVPEAAISAAGLHVDVKRDGVAAPGALEVMVSSDGRTLNLQPRGFLAPGSHYTVTIRGRTYRTSSWLADRLRWLCQGNFAHVLEFEVRKDSGAPALAEGWAIRSLYLTQPKALDTYIPAALDGQAFIALPFGAVPASSGDGTRFGVLVVPALSTDGTDGSAGGLQLLAEPARAAVLAGERSGDALRISGSFGISAMGGELKFSRFQLAATIGEGGIPAGNELLASASCLSLRANGSSYHFPMSLIDQLCDPWLRMIGYVNAEAAPLPAELLAASPVRATLSRGREWSLALSGAPGDAKTPHLAAVILYDSATSEILESRLVSFQGESTSIALPGFTQAASRPSSKLTVFVDARAVTAY